VIMASGDAQVSCVLTVVLISACQQKDNWTDL